MRHTWGVSIAVVGLSLACGAPEAEEDYADAVTADPDHYSVEFENDAVRILRIAYGPGEGSTMHTHPANCSIALGPASWRMTDAEGAVTEDGGGTPGELQCGDAEVHLPENSGTEASELILVEFKEGATAGPGVTSDYSDAVTADPEHYSVEFENEVARLLRIRYGPGETSVMHNHPANCAVFLNDQQGQFELPDGEVQEVPASELGEVMCSDVEDHLPTNLGDQSLELIVVEFKGRASLQP